MVEIKVVYEGGLHAQAVHGPSAAVLSTDAPADNMGRGESFSPTDLTATSLLTCMLTTIGIAIEKKGLDVKIDGATGTVRKIMTSELPRRIARLEVGISLPVAPSQDIRDALEKAALNCPVALSLHPEIEKPTVFHWATA